MMLARGDIIDLLAGEDECLVLLEDRCLRLSAVAAVVVVMLERPHSLAEVGDHLADLFGPPPPGALDQVVDELSAAGVVRSVGKES